MALSWDDVVALAPGLSEVSAEAQALIIEHVELLVGPKKWGGLVDMGQRYLACHLGTLALQAATSGGQAVGPVVSRTVGPVSHTFAVLSSGTTAASLATTTYGSEYAALRRLLPSRFGLTS